MTIVVNAGSVSVDPFNIDAPVQGRIGNADASPDAQMVPGRAFRVNCSGPGNVSVTLEDGSTELITMTSAGYFVFPYAVTKVNSLGTTATATYANLK